MELLTDLKVDGDSQLERGLIQPVLAGVIWLSLKGLAIC